MKSNKAQEILKGEISNCFKLDGLYLGWRDIEHHGLSEDGCFVPVLNVSPDVSPQDMSRAIELIGQESKKLSGAGFNVKVVSEWRVPLPLILDRYRYYGQKLLSTEQLSEMARLYCNEPAFEKLLSFLQIRCDALRQELLSEFHSIMALD